MKPNLEVRALEKYIKSVQMAAQGQTNGGIILLLPKIVLKIFMLVPLIYLWRVLLSSPVETEYNMSQMLGYTYAAAILADLLSVRTKASGWLSEGVLQTLYSRPLSVVGQLIALTVGAWLPMLMLFSLPMAIIAPAFKINLLPQSYLFWPSLLLCISLGFAIDLIFASLSLHLRNLSWLISRIRSAITALFTGTFIPIALLPLGLDKILPYQPFAALGGSPLQILVGTGYRQNIIMIQIIWNLILWPLALIFFKKSQEKMVSYGG